MDKMFFFAIPNLIADGFQSGKFQIGTSESKMGQLQMWQEISIFTVSLSCPVLPVTPVFANCHARISS